MVSRTTKWQWSMHFKAQGGQGLFGNLCVGVQDIWGLIKENIQSWGDHNTYTLVGQHFDKVACGESPSQHKSVQRLWWDHHPEVEENKRTSRGRGIREGAYMSRWCSGDTAQQCNWVTAEELRDLIAQEFVYLLLADAGFNCSWSMQNQ